MSTSSQSLSPLSTVWDAPYVQAYVLQEPSQWSVWKARWISRASSTTVSQRFPRRRICRTTLSRAASSSSQCLSSPVPVQVVPRQAMHVSSPSSSVTGCSSPTQQVVLQSGVAQQQLLLTAQTRKERDQHGVTHSSRTTLSMVLVCSSDRTRSGKTWQQRLQIWQRQLRTRT